MSGDVWVVLLEDRHADVEALPFSTKELAVGAALGLAGEFRADPGDVKQDAELTPSMRADGWVLYAPYGSEGDCVRVVKRVMDAGQ